MPPRGLFVTGTDTGVGKTVVTSAVLRMLISEGMNVAAYKPACSGAVYSQQATDAISAGETPHSASVADPHQSSPLPHWEDVESLFSATQGRWPCERICPQRFLAPLSPPAAAARERRSVDEALLVEGFHWLADRADLVIVEGAGGFYSPISAHWLNADLAVKIGLPVVVVSPNRLGTINHTLLTIEAIRHRGLEVAGVVLNSLVSDVDESFATNRQEIEQRGLVSVWGQFPHESLLRLQPGQLPETIAQALRVFVSGGITTDAGFSPRHPQ